MIIMEEKNINAGQDIQNAPGNQNNQKKKSWTAIDTVIIALVVIVAAVLVLKFGSFEKTNTEDVTFTVLVTSQEESLANAIKSGDSVTLSLTEKDKGTVEKVEVKPAVQMTYDSINGTYQNIEVPSRKDIYIDIKAKCKKSDLAVKDGNTAIKVGMDIPVRGKGYATNGFVITINE